MRTIGMDKTLTTLRKRIRNKVTEKGIWMVYRSRYEGSARDVAAMVRKAGGQAHVMKVGKMTKIQAQDANGGRYSTLSKPWRVEFTVGTDEDLYLTGRINAQKYADMAPHLR